MELEILECVSMCGLDLLLNRMVGLHSYGWEESPWITRRRNTLKRSIIRLLWHLEEKILIEVADERFRRCGSWDF